MLGLKAQIVSAHVARSTVDPADLPKLINDVHRAMTNAEQPPAPQKGEPAVPVRQSIKADHLVCLECEKHFSMLRRHLLTDHELTPDQYRQKWDLPWDSPIVAAEYAKVRSRLAKKIGLGRLPGNTGRKGTQRAAR